MSLIHFKLSTEEDQDFERVLALESESTFFELHQFILDSIDFDHTQLASFYLCNDEWMEQMEISLIDMSVDEDHLIPTMDKTLLSDFIRNKAQKLKYVYDFAQMWTFRLEVSKIEEEDDYDDATDYPALLSSQGESPDQYMKVGKFAHLSDDEHKLVSELQLENFQLFHSDEEFGSSPSGFMHGFDDDDDLEDDEDDDDPFSDFKDGYDSDDRY